VSTLTIVAWHDTERTLKLRLGLGFVHLSSFRSVRSEQQTGPTLLTAGPWRPVSLHTYHTRISDLHISAEVDENLEATLIVRMALSPQEGSGTSEVLLKDPSGSIVASQSSLAIKGGAARAEFRFVKGEVKLWYPVGYGDQPLYDVQVKVFDDVCSSSSGTNLYTQFIIIGKSVIGYPNPKDWVPPRACCRRQVDWPARPYLALRNK
jgi:hypothetical protein